MRHRISRRIKVQLCNRKQPTQTTLTNDALTFQVGKWDNHYSFTQPLSQSWSKMHKTYRFVQYTPKKSFNNFVQSVVDARRAGDENPDSSVVAETMRMLGKSSYGYQILSRSRHRETK